MTPVLACLVVLTLSNLGLLILFISYKKSVEDKVDEIVRKQNDNRF